MRALAMVLGVALLATAGKASGADFSVGRVTLRVTDDGWMSVGASNDALPFGGSRSGAIEFTKHSLLLVDGADRFRAALVVGATRGLPMIDVKWPDDCRSQENVFAIDARQTGGDARDCLRVTALVAIERSLATDAPAVAADLAKRKMTVPTAGYVILDEVALGNGAFVSIEALLAADVELPADSATRQGLPPGVKPEAVAWALRLAEAARSSLHSLSGLLVVPPLAAKTS